MRSPFRRKLRFILLSLLAIAFICFAVLNRQFVHISLFPLPYSADMPEFLFAMICFALGVLVGGGFSGGKLSRTRRLLKQEHKQVMALQNEIGGLKSEHIM